MTKIFRSIYVEFKYIRIRNQTFIWCYIYVYNFVVKLCLQILLANGENWSSHYVNYSYWKLSLKKAKSNNQWWPLTCETFPNDNLAACIKSTLHKHEFYVSKIHLSNIIWFLTVQYKLQSMYLNYYESPHGWRNQLLLVIYYGLKYIKQEFAKKYVIRSSYLHVTST